VTDRAAYLLCKATTRADAAALIVALALMVAMILR
jgi:hypothetical protein